MGVSILIVLNLRIVKCVLCMPTRFCLKNTGPGESSFISRIIIANKGSNSISPIRDSRMSLNLFIIEYMLVSPLYA